MLTEKQAYHCFDKAVQITQEFARSDKGTFVQIPELFENTFNKLKKIHEEIHSTYHPTDEN